MGKAQQQRIAIELNKLEITPSIIKSIEPRYIKENEMSKC